MWRRKTFNRFFLLREGVRQWADKNPKSVIMGMCCVLLAGVLGILISRQINRDGYLSPIDRAFSDFRSRSAAPRAPMGPGPSDLLDIMTLYSATRGINPDSLRAKDSTFLKGIDKQLNSIIHEKD